MIDLDALVNKAVADQFAEAVTYNPLVTDPERGAFAARGVFDADAEILFEAIANSENKSPGHSTTTPMLGVRPAELELEPSKGDRVTVRGVVYEVWDTQADGDGWVDLFLRKRI